MATGIFSGSKVLVEVAPSNFLPLKNVTQWATSGGERSSTTRSHLNPKDGSLAIPSEASPYLIDINDATIIQSDITWRALKKAFGDPDNDIDPSIINIALLADGKATKTYTTPAEVGVTVAVTGADYTGATGKYYQQGLVTLAGTQVGDATKQVTRLVDASIETGKQIEIGTQILSVTDIVSDTDASKTFRVYNPSGAAVTAVGTATGFKAGNPVECFGVTTRSAPSGFACHVLNPGTPSRTSGEPRTGSAQLQPVSNQLPNPTLVAFQS